QAKSKSRSNRSVGRRGSRSAKLNARSSKRGGRLYARGRRGRSRWRRQVATSSHSVGVHNFLSQSWTQPLSAAEKTPAGSEVESTASVASTPAPSGETKTAA